MAKRQATEQITREAFHDDVSDDNEERPKQATSQILAQRKVLKPRGKLGEGTGSAKKSVFQAPLGDTFQFNPPASNTVFPIARPKADDEANKIRALNINFVNKINESNKASAIADLTPIAEKYIKYYKEIKNGTMPNVATVSAAQSENIREDQSSSDDEANETESKKEVKIEGPKFSFNPKPTSSSSSPFTFDPKKIAKLNEKDSDDSDDDVPIQGPTFKFDKPIQDNIFKLKGASSTDKEVASNNTDKTNSGVSTQPLSQTTFGAGPQSTPSIFSSASNSAFNIGANLKETGEKEIAKPADANSLSNPTNTPGLFKFGSTGPAFGASSSEKPSTIFSFGAKTEQTALGANASNPVFPSFGEKPAGSTSCIPAFNFGAKLATTGPLAGSEKSSSSEGATTLGLFGTKPTESATTKSFQFGGSTSFGGAKASSTPFTSNAFNQNATDKPAASESSKSGFVFGQKPEASSGQSPANAFGNATTNISAPSGNPFGGLGSTFQWGKQSAPDKEEDKRDDDKVEEHEVEGNFIPVAQMNDKKEVQSGEENEEAKFTIRAKLMEFDASNTTNPYVNKGLGELKVLRNEETSKSRVVIRADGSLRVLLNTLLSKDVSYSSMGNGSLVRIPVFSGENKIETYVVKVKTADDGKELLKTIEDLKS